ncbi:hypothetical protein G6355_11010 [Vibrio cholerae]|uniref:Uncharacterized protein n=1 Tax=Vibrio cholerae TaxID=666 RepID=A0ABD7SRI9_VIBCL|nr:hypothetical protein [Vibrio cholerae]KFE28785.1 hypothetical protein DN30_537 [Vibrio cholerae]MBY4641899.1 hypothetical protein [Vibrio cholerae]MCR9658171.1 hypothetical protein [Vibrio cholerae]MCR9688852.1 hypothetical protein [Vibrio cholerae]MCR9737360.1 hypothetical protein [Vibrio cholerae]
MIAVESLLKEQLKHLKLLTPANPEACKECGEVHHYSTPHNKDSLYYQYNFARTHGRWPTWADASAHCSEDIQETLKEYLKSKSITFN